jgi:hypothetical protein
MVNDSTAKAIMKTAEIPLKKAKKTLNSASIKASGHKPRKL